MARTLETSAGKRDRRGDLGGRECCAMNIQGNFSLQLVLGDAAMPPFSPIIHARYITSSNLVNNKTSFPALYIGAHTYRFILNEGASGTRDRNFLTLIYIQGSWWKVNNLHHRALFCATLRDPIFAFSEASHRSHRPHLAFESTTIQEKSLILVVPP